MDVPGLLWVQTSHCHFAEYVSLQRKWRRPLQLHDFHGKQAVWISSNQVHKWRRRCQWASYLSVTDFRRDFLKPQGLDYKACAACACVLSARDVSLWENNILSIFPFRFLPFTQLHNLVHLKPYHFLGWVLGFDALSNASRFSLCGPQAPWSLLKQVCLKPPLTIKIIPFFNKHLLLKTRQYYYIWIPLTLE